MLFGCFLKVEVVILLFTVTWHIEGCSEANIQESEVMLKNKNAIFKISKSLQNWSGSWNFLCESEAEKKILEGYSLVIENLSKIYQSLFRS